jgi:acyl carrier protein
MTKDVREQLAEIFAAVLGCDPASLRDSDSNETVAGWDSVNHMQLLLTVEDAFGVQFAPEEFAELTTFGALRARLEASRNGGRN